ncbi:MAG: hypothetical protein IMF06_06455 [Proteobacteria bacterium]|nr:hypothetical protein [Pseudomonadota bacterium]
MTKLQDINLTRIPYSATAGARQREIYPTTGGMRDQHLPAFYNPEAPPPPISACRNGYSNACALDHPEKGYIEYRDKKRYLWILSILLPLFPFRL